MPESKTTRQRPSQATINPSVRVGRKPVQSSSTRHRFSSSGGDVGAVTSNRKSASRPVVPVKRLRGRSKRREAKELQRSASEPILWAVQFVSDIPRGPNLPPLPSPAMVLQRPHTCYDLFSPPSPHLPPSPFASGYKIVASSSSSSWEDAKVVMSVMVEGSTGPVRELVRLGASVEEMIKAVVERYAREGRSPKLEPAAASTFQLHHSHFCLQSLNKSDKIGEVGGRNFYLHKNSASNSFYLKREDASASGIGSEITYYNAGPPATGPTHFLFTFIIRKLNKIGRRTRRLWRIVTCITCT